MKKIISTLLLLAVMLVAQAQDTLRMPMTPPVNYYPECVRWMTANPYESYLTIRKLTQACGAEEVYGYPLKSPLRIVGLAGIFDTVYGNRPMESRVPEYMCLYQPRPDTMELKKKVCWTETQPVCRILLHRIDHRTNTWGWEVPNLYEVYFDDTVTVQDSFYVGCTFCNDYRMAGPMTAVYRLSSNGRYEGLAMYRIRCMNLPGLPEDTNWSYWTEAYCRTSVFPIIDTTGMFADTVQGGDTTIVDTTIVDTTSISPMADQFTYLMPNPATDQATVYSSFPMLRVAVYDPTGRCVLRRRVDDRTLRLDLTGYAKGTYLIVIHTPAGRAVKRLVVR